MTHFERIVGFLMSIGFLMLALLALDEKIWDYRQGIRLNNDEACIIELQKEIFKK